MLVRRWKDTHTRFCFYFRAIFLPLLDDSAHDNCVKIVVGTKLDLVESMSRAVSTQDGQALANEINSPRLTGRNIPLYFETSSRTGFNVEKAFESLFKLCEPAMKAELGEDVDLTDGKGGAGSKKSGCCWCWLHIMSISIFNFQLCVYTLHVTHLLIQNRYFRWVASVSLSDSMHSCLVILLSCLLLCWLKSCPNITTSFFVVIVHWIQAIFGSLPVK